jgi:hypothetical protein
MRRSLLAVMTMALAFGVAEPIDAQTGTHCNFEFIVIIDPGIGMSPSSGTHRTEGGPLTCDGLVNGKEPTGEGIIAEEGRYGTKDGDTCASGGEGDGVDILKVPTAGGIEAVVSEFTFTFGDRLPTKGGLAAGQFEGSRFSGTFEFTPTEGDCITAPVTKARLVGEGVIHR